MIVGEHGIELVGVATAIIPVIKEQNSSQLEDFMSNFTSFTPLRFVVLSPMNFYNRIVVGADGKAFTLGWGALQELAGLHLVDQPVNAGSYRIKDGQTVVIRTTIKLSLPFSINIWGEPLLDVLAVYAYREGLYYLWKPESARN
jgi:hypothetical protein